ncbi:MAG: hypothetical protein Q8N14_05695 [Candidatus Omnitrophota bacterium]|nr:hypothetical protein [Candidatus Omnitrophota bacterium]
MKRMMIWLSVFLLAGCVTVKVPKYLEEDFPYRQDFYANFDTTFNAISSALKELGWKITETTSPSVFNPQETSPRKQVLIFTEIRQTPLFLASAYASMNAYLREIDEKYTQVEIRYILVMPFFKSYQNDAMVDKIFSKIKQNLKK